MKHKKEIIILTTLALAVLSGSFTCFSYFRQKARNTAIKQIEKNGGDVVSISPQWVKELPGPLKELWEGSFGKPVTAVIMRASQDIKPLYAFPDLKALVIFPDLGGLFGGEVFDVDQLKYLTQLERLTLHDVKMKNLDSLGHLVNLTHLLIESTNEIDLTLMEKLTKLEYLVIPAYAGSDFKPIKNCINLKELVIYGPLDFSDSTKMPRFIEELKRLMPNCNISRAQSQHRSIKILD